MKGSSESGRGTVKRRGRKLPVSAFLSMSVATTIATSQILMTAPLAMAEPDGSDSAATTTVSAPEPAIDSGVGPEVLLPGAGAGLPADTGPLEVPGFVPAPAGPVAGPPPAAPGPAPAPEPEPEEPVVIETPAPQTVPPVTAPPVTHAPAPGPAATTTTTTVQAPVTATQPPASPAETGEEGSEDAADESTAAGSSSAEAPASSSTAESTAGSTAETTGSSAPATGTEAPEETVPAEESGSAETTGSSTSEAETPAEESGSTAETDESAEPPIEGEQASVAPTAAVIPEPPKADEDSIRQVLAREPIVEEAKPATKAEAADIYSEIAAVANIREEERRNGGRRDDDRDRDEWDGKVRPFDPRLIRYDDRRHHGPIFCNPWKDRWLETSYWYRGQHYVRRIPPGQSLFIDVDVRVHQVYGFTAVQVKVNAFGVRVVVNVSNGFFHPVGWQPPVYNNVEVHVAVNQQYYRPFPVKKVVYCGYDNVRRKDRFIFDDGYEVWGRAEWSQDRKHITKLNLEESSAYAGFRPEDAGIVEGVSADSPYPTVAQKVPQVGIDHAASESTLVNTIPWIVGGVVSLALIFGVVRPLIQRRRT